MMTPSTIPDYNDAIHLLLDATNESAFLIDIHGHFLAMNSIAAERLGQSKEDLLGKCAYDIIPEDLAKTRKKEIDKSIQNKEPITIIDERNGMVLENRIYPVVNKNGVVEQVAVYAKDITEIQAKEKLLKESREQYKDLVHNAQSIIIKIDAQANIIFANEYAVDFFGFKLEELLGKNLMDTIVPKEESTGKDLEHMVYDGFEDPSPYIYNENENICKDGRRVWIAWRNKIINDENGNVKEVLSIGIDITRKKHAESDLVKNQQIRRALLNATDEAAMLLDIEGKFLAMNSVCAKRMGREKSELLGNCAFDFFQPELAQSRQEALNIVIKTKELYTYIDVQDGRTLENRIYPVLDSQNKVYQVAIYSKDISELKKNENELLNIKNKLYNFIESNHASIFFLDFKKPMPISLGYEDSYSWFKKNLYLENCNNAFARTLGLKYKEEVIGLSIIELFKNHEGLLKSTFDLYYHSDYQLINKEIHTPNNMGLRTYSIDNSTPVIKDGLLHAIHGTSLDISFQKKIENELNSAKEKLSYFIDKNPGGILFIRFKKPMPLNMNLEETIEWVKKYEFIADCNDAAAIDYGYSFREDIIGRSTYDVLAQNDTALRNILTPHVESNFETTRFVTEEATRHGEIKHFLNSVFPIRENNKLLGLNLIALDITDKIKLEQQLKESNEKLEYFISSNPASIYFIRFKKPLPQHYDLIETLEWIKKNEYVDNCNDAAAINWGYRKKQDLIGRSTYEILNKNDDLLKAIIKPHYDKNWSYINEETHTIDKEGKVIYYVNSSFPVLKNKRIVGLNIISFDITRIKQLEVNLIETKRELETSLTAKDKFISILSHDLRAPFNAILGFSEILVERIQKNNFNDLEKFAKLVRDSSFKTFDLLENLLLWGNAHRGALTINKQKHNLNDLVLEVYQTLSSTAVSKNIELKLALCKNSVVLVDKSMIKIAIRNLLSNAIKFTSEEGKIEIKTTTKGKWIKLTVSDNGQGIAPNKLKNLFKIEHTHSTPGTKGEKGTGLGLLLCKEFVDKNEGEISTTSQVGKGTTFTIKLPLQLSN
jgi:PAS domain S-box-containing protein